MKVTRYLVVKVWIEMDTKNKDDVDEIVDYVANELDYNVDFNDFVEIDDKEIAVKIVDTEVQALLEAKPLGY